MVLFLLSHLRDARSRSAVWEFDPVECPGCRTFHTVCSACCSIRNSEWWRTARLYLLAVVGLVMMWRDPALRLYALSLAGVGRLVSLELDAVLHVVGAVRARLRDSSCRLFRMLAPTIAVAIDRLHGIAARAAVAGLLAVSLVIAVSVSLTRRRRSSSTIRTVCRRWCRPCRAPRALDVSLPTFTEEDWLEAPGSPNRLDRRFRGRRRRHHARDSFEPDLPRVGRQRRRPFSLFGATAQRFRRRPQRRPRCQSASRRGVQRPTRSPGARSMRARLRAVDLHAWRRLSGVPLQSALTVAVSRQGESLSSGKAGEVGPSFELPEGEWKRACGSMAQRIVPAS